jgi:D-glycero-alpha-D-manno-heptose-7-phosphate kinase
MQIVRSPFRISFFGGSTDYESFFKNNESFIIGTTINKYVYCSLRPRLHIHGNDSIISYSKLETVDNFNKISNNLIRETIKYYNFNEPIELHFFSDIPSRTGLGGSSSFCISLCSSLRSFLNKKITKKILTDDAIKIERHILKESGGIQDQIHSSFGGFNSIEIKKDGTYLVKPIPITYDFLKEFENSLLLIYTNEQRNNDIIAKSHENKDKKNILEISKHAYSSFIKEDIKNIGNLLYQTWNEKRNISKHITNKKIDDIINDLMSKGAYGAKLLGSGGCGFILCICNSHTKKILIEKYKQSIFDFKFESEGTKEIYKNL